MFNPELFSPQRQAEIAKMTAYDNEQRRIALYNPETQPINRLRMISEYYRHNYNYTKRKMLEKWTNMKRNSKYFSDIADENNKIENGEIFKMKLKHGESYCTSSMNDQVDITLDIEVVDGIYPIDPEIELEEASITELDSEEKSIELSEESQEKVLFTESNLNLKYYLYDETTFFGLDAVVSSMNRGEESKFVIYGLFLTNLFTFLRKYSSKSEEEITQLQELFKQKPYVKGNTKGLMVKVKVSKKESKRIVDISNDGGVFKEQVEEAKEYDGLGWANESDHVIISVQLVKGHKSDEEVDYGELSCIWKEWDVKLLSILPKGVLLGMTEIKQSEIALIKILPKTVNDRYTNYASDEFRSVNDLYLDQELVYRVTTRKIEKVYRLLEDKIRYRVIAKGKEYEVKTPRVMQRVSFKLRWFINKYKLKNVKTIEEKSIVQKELMNKIFFLGMGNNKENEQLTATEDYKQLAFIRTYMCQLPMFLEKVLMKMNRNRRVEVTTSDKELIYQKKELDMVLETMLLKDEGNITDGIVLEKIKEVKNSTKTIEEQVKSMKEYYLSLVTTDKEDEEIELKVELLVSYFESKDTYWDIEPDQRRVLMKEYKEQGNCFFKKGCFEQAIDCYRTGIRVYSNHNYTMIGTQEVKDIVKPLKITLLLNIAVAYSKVQMNKKNKKGLKSTFEELEEFTKDDKEEEKLKIYLKRGSVELNLKNLVKGKEWLMKVQKIDPNFKGLKSEFKRLKEMIEQSKAKTKQKYKGFLNKSGNKDVLATEQSRTEQKKKKPDSLDFSNIERKDWHKKAKEFYGID